MLINLYYIINKSIFINKLKLSYKKLQLIINYLYNSIYTFLLCIILKPNYIYLILKKNNFKNLFFFLKNNIILNFSQLLNIVIVDRLKMKLIKNKRFNYIYVILSIVNNIRIFISGFISIFEILISLIEEYKSAD